MKKIMHFVHVNAAPADVYNALTTAEGLAGWWSTQVSVQPGVGGIIDFTFVGDFHPDMQVTELVEHRQVAWRCVSGHDNWRDNTFLFDLRPADDVTDLMFVQIYAQELSDEVYGTYNFNWGYYLHSLKLFCETGAGTPYTPAA